MFLVNSRQGHLSAACFCIRIKSLLILQATLIANLRVQFAEFLNRDSLVRLWIFTSPTCVGLRYGLNAYSLSSYFSAVRILLITSSPIRYLIKKDLPLYSPTGLNAHIHPCAKIHLLRHCIGKTHTSRYWNINQFTISYAFRPHLRLRLTLGRFALPRNP